MSATLTWDVLGPTLVNLGRFGTCEDTNRPVSRPGRLQAPRLERDSYFWPAAYIFDLLRRVVTVSLRTIDVVDSLPPLDLA